VIQIGQPRIVVVKRRENGKLVPVLDEDQKPLTKTLSAEV